MNEAPVDAWVAKADEDYRGASVLDAADIPDIVCFHCQQCIEKYLKAGLVQHGAAVRKIHNLIVLNSLVTQHDARFAELNDGLDVLNPYAVITRYPGFDITPDDAREAVQIMQELRAEIRTLLALDPK